MHSTKKIGDSNIHAPLLEVSPTHISLMPPYPIKGHRKWFACDFLAVNNSLSPLPLLLSLSPTSLSLSLSLSPSLPPSLPHSLSLSPL